MDTTTDNVTPITSTKRARQQTLDAPGMASQVDNPAIEAAAAAYVAVRNERMELTKREKELKETLLAVVVEAKVERYDYIDDEGETMRVAVKTKHKVTVRKASSDGADGDEDEE